MDTNFYKQVLNLGNGSPNQLTPILVINKDLSEKQSETGVKRKRHPINWIKNKRKFLKNSVIYI